MDAAVYENIFTGVTRILTKEKKGFDKDSFSEELQGIVVKDYSSNRCYFLDMGLTNLFLTKSGAPKATVSGILNENFVYLDLRRRISHPSEIALETPAFATLGNGEIDFYVKGLASERTYAVEVKSGKNSGKTAAEALEKKKADYVLYAKGSTCGGKANNIITIPIYGIAKFQF